MYMYSIKLLLEWRLLSNFVLLHITRYNHSTVIFLHIELIACIHVIPWCLRYLTVHVVGYIQHFRAFICGMHSSLLLGL